MCLQSNKNMKLVAVSGGVRSSGFPDVQVSMQDLKPAEVQKSRSCAMTGLGQRRDLSNKRKRASSVSAKTTCSADPERKRSKTTKGGDTPSLTTKGFRRHFAKHNYHDFARTKPHQLEVGTIKSSRGGVHNPFPAVLHTMVEEAEEKGFSDLISWQSHGRAFLIRNPKTFVTKVLPNYFKHSKLSSFQRQLSLYGFVRLTHDGPDRGAYYHECFLRGRPFLCSKIARTRVKGTWVRTSSSPESEPDFYSMDPVVDLDEVDTQAQSRNTAETAPSTATCGSAGEDSLSDNGDLDSENNSIMYLEFDFSGSTIDIPVNEPPQDAGLLPPPAFPTHVVGSASNTIETKILPIDRPTEPQHSESTAPSTWATPKLPSFEIPSLVSAMAFPSAPMDDDELARFLTDVDLETDFDTEDVIKITTV